MRWKKSQAKRMDLKIEQIKSFRNYKRAQRKTPGKRKKRN